MRGRASSGEVVGNDGPEPDGPDDATSRIRAASGESIFDSVAVSSRVKSEDESESDACGSWERGHNVLIGFHTDQGVKNVPYHSISSEQDPAKDCRWIEVDFHGPYTVEDEKRDGLFTIRIEGERLRPLMRRIRKGWQTEVWISGKVEDQGKSQVDSIAFRDAEDEG